MQSEVIILKISSGLGKLNIIIRHCTSRFNLAFFDFPSVKQDAEYLKETFFHEDNNVYVILLK